MLKLPDNLPTIATARLPANYEAAKTALAKCEAVDECKDLADRMMALAVYAKQANDEEMLHMARRIQARALRRAGELLLEVESAAGRPPRAKEIKDGAVPNLGRVAAAEEAGLSERQRKTALKLAAVDEDEFEALVESFSPPTITELAEGRKPHRAQATGNDEWHTSVEILERARAALGGIALDPASCLEAQKNVQASLFFTREQDGLSQPWEAQSVWLNPPFSQPNCANFVSKLVREFKAGHVKAAILLTHNSTETSWFQEALSACTAICFPSRRLKFYGPSDAPLQGHAIFYFGRDIDAFAVEFEPIGIVMPFYGRLPSSVPDWDEAAVRLHEILDQYLSI